MHTQKSSKNSQNRAFSSTKSDKIDILDNSKTHTDITIKANQAEKFMTSKIQSVHLAAKSTKIRLKSSKIEDF